MIDFHSDLKSEYCKKCKEKTAHKRTFTGITKGHNRLISVRCMVCDTKTIV